jgi:site-specific DNA recombinase
MITIEEPLPERRRAVAYVRVSSIKQKDNASPETQMHKIQEYADANNIEIVDWFKDIARSAKNANREGLQDMIKFAIKERERINHVIVYKMSRVSRDAPTFYNDIFTKLTPRGVTIRSATENFDDTPTGKFMQLLHLGIGQLDNHNKSEYTKDVMNELASQGYYQHPPLVGYVCHKVKNSEGKRRPSLKQDEMAIKVRQVLERFNVGDISKAELTRYGEEIGLRSKNGNVICKNSIHTMIENPTYAGYVRDVHTHHELVEGKHEGIISKEIYSKNQILLHAKNSRKEEVHHKKNELYVLKGTIRCPQCNKPMRASAPRTGNGGYSPRYHCGKCSEPTISARLAHQDFQDMLKQIKPSEGTLRLFKEVLIREANNQLGRVNKEVEKLRNELNDISTDRFNAIKKFTKDQITLQEKNDLVDALEIQKLDTEATLKDIEGAQALRESEIEYAITFMESVDHQWATADFDLQQKFQNMIFPNGVVYDAQNRSYGTSEISALYRLADIKNSPAGLLKFNLVAGAGLEPATSWL